MNETIEIWKSLDFIDYPNYAVSNFGNVKSFIDNHLNYREKILKPIKRSNYLQVGLHKDGKTKHFLVHRLVALAFIPNPNNLPEINHKDENPLNNCVENLEFCDRKYNVNYGTAIKRRAEKLKGVFNRQYCSKPVNQYTKEGVLVGSYPSTNEAQRQTGFDQGFISKCCNGKRQQAYGFVWRYLDSCQ